MTTLSAQSPNQSPSEDSYDIEISSPSTDSQELQEKFECVTKIYENEGTPFVAKANIPSIFGKFEVYGFLEKSVNKEHLAIKCGDIDPYNCNVRVHSECWTGDVMGSMKCDCRDQLAAALNYISEHGGIVLYLRQEGRGIGLLNKLKAYSLQEQGYDTVEANLKLGFEDDLRTYECAVEMLRYFGIKKIRLLTNNPKKIGALADAGIEVQREAHQLTANPYNIHYLKTKASKSGHILEFNKQPTMEDGKKSSDISKTILDTLSQENERYKNLYHESLRELEDLKRKCAELEGQSLK